MMNVLIVGSSKFPIPAVKGGAVPNLIEELIFQQEKENKINLFCASLYDEEAFQKSKKYEKTTMIWVKTPRIVKFFDKMMYLFFAKILHIKRLQSISFIFQVIYFAFFLSKIIKKNDFDRIIFENSVPLLFSLRLKGNYKKYKGKYYVHMHSVPRKYYFCKKEFNNCKKLVCVSQYVADEILKCKDITITKDRVFIMFNCLNTGEFELNKIDIRQQYNIPSDYKIVSFVGRLCSDKGILQVLDAFNSLKNEKMVLLIVGSNFYKSGIKSAFENTLYSKCENNSNIIFTGYVDYFLIPSFFSQSNVVVLPSIWDEPAGMTIIEAMYSYAPVITTRSGGIPEYVGNNTCILLDRNDKLVENIASNIENIVFEKIDVREMTTQSHNKASIYNERFYYSQLLNLLEHKD